MLLRPLQTPEQTSSILQQLMKEELVGLRRRGVQTVLPTCSPGPRQTLWSSWARTSSSMHSAAAVAHRGSQTLCAFSRLCPTSGGIVRIPWGIAIFQPSDWRFGSSIILSHHLHLGFRNCVDSLAPQSPVLLYEHGRARQSFSARLCPGNGLALPSGSRTCA